MTSGRRAHRSRRGRAGFSLLEVMVAMAFLALALTALFASEVGAWKTVHHARQTTVATFLARCKMSEIEADVLENGFQVSDVVERDEPCCMDEDEDGFSCSWRIETLGLEELGADELSTDSSANGNPLGDLLGGGGEEDGPPDPSEITGGASAEDILGGSAAMSNADIVSGLATDYVWPLIAPSLDQQVRKVTVEVAWSEDDNFEVVQYVVLEPAGGGLLNPTPGTETPGTTAPGATPSQNGATSPQSPAAVQTQAARTSAGANR